MMYPSWNVTLTGLFVSFNFTSLPLLSNNLICGLNPFDCPVFCLDSITTSVDNPVTSSICLATDTPSTTFSNFAMPSYSEIIGLL